MIEKSKTPRYRFFLEPYCFDRKSGKASCDDVKLNHQMRNVLRLGDGDLVQLLDGEGHVHNARLRLIGRNKASFDLESDVFFAPPAVVSTIYLPLIKPHRFEWALEKLTELSVVKIVPFYSQRCTVKNKEDGGKNKRWQSICREAAEQCERPYLPVIGDTCSLKQVVNNDTASVKLRLRERSDAPDMVTLLKSLYNNDKPTSISILVGPEGGFTDEEQALISAQNFTDTTIGATILRSETACMVAAGLLSTIGFEKD